MVEIDLTRVYSKQEFNSLFGVNLFSSAQRKYFSFTGKSLSNNFITTSDYIIPKSSIFWNPIITKYLNGMLSRHSICSQYGLTLSQLSRLFKFLGVRCSQSLQRDYAKQTILSKFGVSNPGQSKVVQDKMKNTLKSRYGVIHPSHILSVKEKKKQSTLKHYNVLYPLQSLDIRTKRNNSILTKKVEEVLKCLNMQGYELLESYRGMWDTSSDHKVSIKYKFKHLKCGHEFYHGLDSLPMCTYCYKSSHRSNLEELYSDYIKSLGFEVTLNSRILVHKGHAMELDIFVPSLNIGFEVNGLYWHSLNGNANTKVRTSMYHQLKTQVALNQGIKLYHIWENDNPVIVKSMMTSRLGQSQNRIYSRLCSVKEVSTAESELFFEVNHLHGYTPSFYNLGLYYNDILVSCISFRKHPQGVEIARFASKLYTQVIGSFQRLLKHSIVFLKSKGYKRIVTYADRDWSPDPQQTVYEKSGFTWVGDSGPILRYTNFKEVKDRRTFQKYKLKVLFPNDYSESLSANNILAMNGWFPIYNSGNLKYIKEL